MFHVQGSPVTRNPLHHLLQSCPILGVRPFQNHIDGDFRRRLQFKYPKSLSGPVDLSAGTVPAEATCLAEFLGLSEVGLAGLEMPVHLLKPYGHVVEHAAESRDFVVPRGRHSVTEITFGQSCGTLHKPSERLSDTARDHPTEEGSEHERNYGGEWHDKKNPPLSLPHVQARLCSLFADRTVNILDQRRTPRFQWPHLVG